MSVHDKATSYVNTWTLPPEMKFPEAIGAPLFNESEPAKISELSLSKLRLEDMYGAKIGPPYTFPSIILLLDHLSKIRGTTFWPSDQRCQKSVYIFKVTFRGRAEIQNGRICWFFDSFHFSSETRDHFQKLTYFSHPWPFGQKVVPQIFERWPNNRIIKGNVQGGSDFSTIRIF